MKKVIILIQVMVLVALTSIANSAMAARPVSDKELLDIVNKQASEIKALQKQVSSLSGGKSSSYETRMREIIQEEVESLAPEEESMFGNIDIHGFISQGYMKTNRNNFLAGNTEDGSFQFNEVGINFGTQLSDQLRVGMQLLSRDLGDIGNNDINLDWAIADYYWQEWLGLRAGKIKVPNGFYNETRDIDMLRTSILLPQGVYNESFREWLNTVQGIGIYGNLDFNELGNLSYQALWGTTNIDKNGGIAKVARNSNPFADYINTDTKYTYAGSLIWNTPLEGLRLGATMLNTVVKTNVELNTDLPLAPGLALPTGTPITIELDNIQIITLSAEYTIDNLIVFSEYHRARWENSTIAHAPLPFGDLTLADKVEEYEAGYLGASYRINDYIEIGTYYSLSRFEHDKQKDLAISTRFDLSDNWTFKLEGHLMDGNQLALGIDNPDGLDNKNWTMFAAKMTFSF